MYMSQIFKNNIPSDILFTFLMKICEKTDSYYIFDNNAYKRGILEENISLFCESIKDYYHISKQHYINRELNYIKFCTVIRQICKSNSIKYNTKIVYNRSKYHIPYHIYF